MVPCLEAMFRRQWRRRRLRWRRIPRLRRANASHSGIGIGVAIPIAVAGVVRVVAAAIDMDTVIGKGEEMDRIAASVRVVARSNRGVKCRRKARMIGGMSPPRRLLATKPRAVRHRTPRVPAVVRVDPGQAGAAGAEVKGVNAGVGINIRGMAAADNVKAVMKVVRSRRVPDLQAHLMPMVPNHRHARERGLKRDSYLPRCRIRARGKSVSSGRISPGSSSRSLPNTWICLRPRFSGKAFQRPIQNRITGQTTTATATGKADVRRRVFA